VCLTSEASTLATDYYALPCTPLYLPCANGPERRVPTDAELHGLDAALFESFYSDLIYMQPDFGWSVLDSSAGGVVIGRVSDFQNKIVTQFVFRGGVLYCCTLDEPFELTDINDDNIIIGMAGISYVFGEFPLTAEPSYGELPFTVHGLPDDVPLVRPGNRLVSIDNQGMIVFAAAGGEKFILSPGWGEIPEEPPEPVPEPGFGVLVLLALVSGWMIRESFSVSRH
jgi:hypothetical protein